MRSGRDGWDMRRMLAACEHDVAGYRRLVSDHSHHVAVDTEVVAVDGGLRAQPHRAVVKDRDPGVPGQGRRRALDGELCSQIYGVAVDGLGVRDHHADVGKLRHFEEVRGAKVVVALAYLGVHRGDLDVDTAENRFSVCDLAVAAELREVALDRCEAPHRLGLEPDRRPSGIDIPDADGCGIAQTLLCAFHVTSVVNRPTPAAGPSLPGRSTRRCD